MHFSYKRRFADEVIALAIEPRFIQLSLVRIPRRMISPAICMMSQQVMECSLWRNTKCKEYQEYPGQYISYG